MKVKMWTMKLEYFRYLFNIFTIMCNGIFEMLFVTNVKNTGSSLESFTLGDNTAGLHQT